MSSTHPTTGGIRASINRAAAIWRPLTDTPCVPVPAHLRSHLRRAAAEAVLTAAEEVTRTEPLDDADAWEAFTARELALREALDDLDIVRLDGELPAALVARLASAAADTLAHEIVDPGRPRTDVQQAAQQSAVWAHDAAACQQLARQAEEAMQGA